MALNFPASPNIGDPYRYGIRTWVWNGVAWQLQINPAFGYGSTTLPGDLVVNGNLTVNGLQTILNTTVLNVDDINVVLGSVTGTTGLTTTNALVAGSYYVQVPSTVGLVPGQLLTKTSGTGAFGASATIQTVNSGLQFTASVQNLTSGAITFSTGAATDLTANGGGLTLLGTTNKSIIWDNTNTNWTSSEHFNLASGKAYKLNNGYAIQGTATTLLVGPQATTSLTLGASGGTVGIASGATFNIGTLTNPTIATGIQTTTNSFDFVPTQATNINIGRAATTIYAGSTGTNTLGIQGTNTTLSFPSSQTVTYSSGGAQATINWHTATSITHNLASNTTNLGIGGLQSTTVQATILNNPTASGSTKTIAIGTSGLSGSVTNIILGSSATNAQGTISLQNNVVNLGTTVLQGVVGMTSGVQSNITAATTIAPVAPIVFLQGTTAIQTITPPAPISTNGGQIVFIPQAAGVFQLGGNVALQSNTVAGRALTMTYLQGTSKWYPSY